MDIWKYIRENIEVVIAFGALIVSIASIVFTYWTIKIQRKHNRLSVKPIPEILLSKCEGVQIELKNLGVGPLRCKELLTKDSSSNVYYHMKDALPPDLKLTGDIFTNRWNFTILPGETITLLSITERWTNASPSDKLRRAMDALSALTLSLKYTSIYDEEFPFYEKPLGWLKS